MEDIVKNNQLIAKFMGAKMIVKNYHDISILKFPDKKTYDIQALKYHCSWDWLLPVYRKIRDIINDRAKLDKHTRTKGDLLELDALMAICEVDIQKAFDSIVAFIKWYNTSLADR